jgi:hypothetical protein
MCVCVCARVGACVRERGGVKDAGLLGHNIRLPAKWFWTFWRGTLSSSSMVQCPWMTFSERLWTPEEESCLFLWNIENHAVTQHHICKEWNPAVNSSAFYCEWCILSFSPNLVLLSIVTATLKIVESLPHFLSPYMDNLLHEVSIQSAKWQQVSDDSKVTPVVHKLKAIR